MREPWKLELNPSRTLRIALIGAESTGKSTLAHMLTARLRTHGLLAAMVAESGSSLPFPPTCFDTEPDAHAYAIASKMAAEARAELRPNVNLVICDRSPWDHAAYYAVRFWGTDAAEDRRDMDSLLSAAEHWTSRYDAMYFLRTKGAAYVEDGFRQADVHNDYRERVDEFLAEHADELFAPVHQVTGDHRARAEFVYHHILHTFFGVSRPLRAYEQVKGWLVDRGWRVREVRPQGSHSAVRFHPASDQDDVDAIVVVDGDAAYAAEAREDFLSDKEQLENVVQASLDLLFTPVGLEALET